MQRSDKLYKTHFAGKNNTLKVAQKCVIIFVHGGKRCTQKFIANKNNAINVLCTLHSEVKVMVKKILVIVISLMFVILAVPDAHAAPATTTYTVVSGDSLWKIAVKYQVGISELIAANPKIANPSLIYPGQVVNIPVADAEAQSYEQQVVTLVNQKRAQNGLKPLTANWQLSRVARYKSQDMHDKNYFSHTSPTYGSPFDMIKSFGISYRTAGENIAMGYKTPQAVVDGWMNSPGHRANILNASFTQIGVGYVASGNYWTQMFIG